MVKKKLPHLLIIGGTGFIGYHLAVAASKKGWKVSSISLNNPKNDRYVKGVNYLKINITNLSNLKKKLKGSFTYVINLGGYVQHEIYRSSRNVITKTHLLGLINLTKVFEKRKIKKFVQAGSSLEYGNSKSPQTEESYGTSNSTYALAKLASTKFLVKLYRKNKFPVIILRFFQVYGPKQDENRILPQIIKGCLYNKNFPTSKGNQFRDFCYIDDVIKAIFLTFATKNHNGEIFNIGFGKPQKIKNVIKQIKQIIGRGKPQFGKIKYKRGENMKLYPNIKKAQKKLRWNPKISFNNGIQIVINSFNKKNAK